MYDRTELKDLVEKAITNLTYDDEAPKLIDPVKYILSIGGKRLRPVLALMSCNLFSDNISEAVMPAIGLEVFHNFTLVHDDIMDQAPVRRNFATVHTKWNISQAVLSGDVMAFIANECFLQTPARHLSKVLRIYNRAAIDVCIGQQLDIDFEKASVVTADEYLRMIELKTAALVAASVKTGAVIGGSPDKDADLMYDFGRNLGLAFQIQDDLLDAYGDSKVFGKVQGGDIVSNKKTYLLVRAFELAAREQSRILHDLFSSNESGPEEKVGRVMEIYDQLNIRSLTESLANEYIDASLSLLDKVEVLKERKSEIRTLVESLVDRKS